MKIIEEFTNTAVAVPKAARVLQDLREVPTFHESYGVRHPSAAYNISLTSVAQRLVALLETLSQVQAEGAFLNERNVDWEIPLLEATDHLLDAQMEHIDDCRGIIRSFFPTAEDKNFKKALSSFKSSVEPYRKHIGSIDNYIKHNQGRLRAVCFSWSQGACLGYFVEGPCTGGALGPVAQIHKNENTAFSFNRDIPFHICNVFAVGALLSATLYSIDRRLVPMALANPVTTRDSNWIKALEMASVLPMIYFPDEVKKAVPRIHIRETKLHVEYPAARNYALSPPPLSRIGITFRGDGVTRSYRMPYFHEQG